MLSEGPTILSDDPTMFSEGFLPCSHRVPYHALTGSPTMLSEVPTMLSRGLCDALRGSNHALEGPIMLSEDPTGPAYHAILFLLSAACSKDEEGSPVLPCSLRGPHHTLPFMISLPYSHRVLPCSQGLCHAIIGFYHALRGPCHALRGPYHALRGLYQSTMLSEVSAMLSEGPTML